MPAIKTNTNDRGDVWKTTAAGASPKDGERVVVRQNGDPKLWQMIFRAEPIMRWESPDGHRAYDFQFFDEWRRY